MPKKTVLVTGGSGYLGQHLLLFLSSRRDIILHGASSGLATFEEDFASLCTCHTLDLSDSAAIASLLGKVKPDVVVHAAALSSPRVCEADPAKCTQINAPSALIDNLPAHASLIFLSTDQVYDGTAAPYANAAAAAPVNAYGASKLAFERMLTSRLPTRHISLRSSLIIGPPPPKRCKKGGSFLQDCAKLLSSENGADFFVNEMRSAVAVQDVVAIIVWAVNGGVTSHPGVYNMGGPESLSRVDIALAVAKHHGLPVNRVHAKPRPEGTGGVKSPLDITMDSSMIQRVSGVRMRKLRKVIPSAFGESTASSLAWPAPSVSVLVAICVLSAALALGARSWSRR